MTCAYEEIPKQADINLVEAIAGMSFMLLILVDS